MEYQMMKIVNHLTKDAMHYHQQLLNKKLCNRYNNDKDRDQYKEHLYINKHNKSYHKKEKHFDNNE